MYTRALLLKMSWAIDSFPSSEMAALIIWTPQLRMIAVQLQLVIYLHPLQRFQGSASSISHAKWAPPTTCPSLDSTATLCRELPRKSSSATSAAAMLRYTLSLYSTTPIYNIISAPGTPSAPRRHGQTHTNRFVTTQNLMRRGEIDLTSLLKNDLYVGIIWDVCTSLPAIFVTSPSCVHRS